MDKHMGAVLVRLADWTVVLDCPPPQVWGWGKGAEKPPSKKGESREGPGSAGGALGVQNTPRMERTQAVQLGAVGVSSH